MPYALISKTNPSLKKTPVSKSCFVLSHLTLPFRLFHLPTHAIVQKAHRQLKCAQELRFGSGDP